MKPRRWSSREASSLFAVTGEKDPAVAISKLAAGLIDEAGFDKPPFDPRILASLQNVLEIRRTPMKSAARLLPEKGALVIEVNQDHSAGKQNFSADHEVTHTLLPTYSGQVVDDLVTGEFSSHSEEELLCDIGAATLLLDPRWLRPLAVEAGASLHTVFQMAVLFGASLQATALQLSKLNIWPCAFVFWEEGYRKSDRIAASQDLLPLMEMFGPPNPKLRVNSAYASSTFGYYVPKNKSVGNTSLVCKCCETREFLYGLEEFDLGHRAINCYCESAYVPYKSGEAIHRRVLSLLLPTNVRTTPVAGPTQYQLEIL